MKKYRVPDFPFPDVNEEGLALWKKGEKVFKTIPIENGVDIVDLPIILDGRVIGHLIVWRPSEKGETGEISFPSFAEPLFLKCGNRDGVLLMTKHVKLRLKEFKRVRMFITLGSLEFPDLLFHLFKKEDL